MIFLEETVAIFKNNDYLWHDFSESFNALRLFENSKEEKGINRNALYFFHAIDIQNHTLLKNMLL